MCAFLVAAFCSLRPGRNGGTSPANPGFSRNRHATARAAKRNSRCKLVLGQTTPGATIDPNRFQSGTADG